jgi:hypothetical protein
MPNLTECGGIDGIAVDGAGTSQDGGAGGSISVWYAVPFK